MIAALYVETGGAYYGIPDVDPWDIDADARKYGGPWPVVAHPPCKRWGRFWGGGPLSKTKLTMGADDGCFAAALASVRLNGGVLEHPEASHAWRAHGLIAPPWHGGWVKAGLLDPGWTCCVEQGAYGHAARKRTWLYAVGCRLPSLRWGKALGDFVRLDAGYHSAEERAGAEPEIRRQRDSAMARIPKSQRAATPPEFRELLIEMARSAT